MKMVYFWLTPQGESLAKRLQQHFGGRTASKSGLAEQVQEAFGTEEALVFVMAAGIAVCAAALGMIFLKKKKK